MIRRLILTLLFWKEEKYLKPRIDPEIKWKTQQIYSLDALAYYEQVLEFVAELRKKYPDYKRYAYYHVLIGSTPTRRCDRYDFPQGEVSRFLDSLLASSATTQQTS